jgi:hypothetical protein
MELFDILFVMGLCFGTLLSTMLLQGGVLVGGNGSAGIHPAGGIRHAALVGLAFCLYLGYLLPRSDKELRAMVSRRYEGPDSGSAQ